MIDVGVYGNATRPQYEARETTRKLEKFVREVGGAQMLYADTYMTVSAGNRPHVENNKKNARQFRNSL